ncbi:DNA alkylation repair protein [Tenacibaculum sp. TC6]|uniref:DNA alkylation repair protein n=1 Tax=Tenacibaculum sp. TC6 TaxID=3423223 RepID=UPI003D35E1EC
MAELFKNIYNPVFFTTFTSAVKEIVTDFNTEAFLQTIYDDDWELKEYKQRMRHVAVSLKQHLPGNFNQHVTHILEIIQLLNSKGIREKSIEYMFFPDFIELYGLDNFTVSVNAFETITQFTSCEFAVRPFIIQYEKEMIKQLHSWSAHKHVSVRRLASEGCRPRLPWAMALPSFKTDPSSIIPILTTLKNDSSEYVRRSVANNLNDISKDHPEMVIQLAQQWLGQSKETDWVVKHACRTLLKQGNKEVMKLFGYSNIQSIQIASFKVHTPTVTIGDFLEFSFILQNQGKTPAKIRLEYGLYYLKANGNLARKVFKISEKMYPENSDSFIVRRQSFKLITTRKFYPGLHQVAIIINGHEFEALDFELGIRN